MVENDQRDYAGKIRPILAFLDDCAEAGIPIKMTFDVGNWSWTGENLLEAAETLAKHVVYVHFKQGLTKVVKYIQQLSQAKLKQRLFI